MKQSFYNFEFPFQEGSDQTIFYNSRTNAMALLEAENYTQYKAFCEDGAAITDEKFLEGLTYGGFLIDDEIDELDLIRFSLLQSRFGNHHLGLTIAPTSDCNFRCIYCYEKDSLRKSTMTEEVQGALIEYVKRVVPIISSVNVSWYGGEPLLALDIIERLTEEIYAICEENKVAYSASIVTNGYLLTPITGSPIECYSASNGGCQFTCTCHGGGACYDRTECDCHIGKNECPCHGVYSDCPCFGVYTEECPNVGCRTRCSIDLGVLSTPPIV